MWKKINPTVQKRFLLLLAGSVWVCIGILLCTRALLWLSEFSIFNEILLAGVGFTFSFWGHKYGVSKIVRKNVQRIHGLPESVCCFAFTPLRGYTMIALMITIGILLRSSSLPRYYLSLPYIAMGGALLMGSGQFFREFYNYKSKKPLHE